MAYIIFTILLTTVKGVRYLLASISSFDLYGHGADKTFAEKRLVIIASPHQRVNSGNWGIKASSL